ASESDRDDHVAHSVFENKIPADNPGDQLAEGRVRIRVRTSGYGNHRSQFRVAQTSETAGNSYQQKGNRDARTCWRPAVHQHTGKAAMGEQVLEHIQHLRMKQGRRGELARGGCAGENEYSRTDNGADSQRGQRPRAQRFLQLVLWVLRIGDEFVDGLLG